VSGKNIKENSSAHFSNLAPTRDDAPPANEFRVKACQLRPSIVSSWTLTWAVMRFERL